MSTPKPEANLRSVKLHYELKKAYVRKWKFDRGCAVCRESDPVVLDADHIDETTKNRKRLYRDNGKSRSLTALSWADLEAELAKCQVLCANCHRRRTAERNYQGVR